LPGVVRDPTGHNFVVGFGLLPNLEVAGRLATNSLDRNCFTEGCGARDLSASAKAGIGLDTANRFRVAAGITDIGGAVTYFRTYYGAHLQRSARSQRRPGQGAVAVAPSHHARASRCRMASLPWVRAMWNTPTATHGRVALRRPGGCLKAGRCIPA
jgi:hypothetical protein